MSFGCPRCRTDQAASNLTCLYDYDTLRREATRDRFAHSDLNLWRYDAFLPLDRHEAISLGEGWTPLVPVPAIGARYGLRRLLVKDETRNPTWSYKDRLCSVAISWAKRRGVPAVTVSSTGNHGASTAAYSARAGLPCIVFTVTHAALPMKTLMQAYGAAVVATPTFTDRWTIMSRCVQELGWFPTGNSTLPPVGSTPYGIEGYKTLGFEICEQLGWKAPDWVVMPVAFADGLYGTWKGFREFARLGLVEGTPRMVAAETHGPLTHALAANLDDPVPVANRETVALSIGTPWGTYQGLQALRESGGLGVVVSDEEILEAQRLLAGLEGLFVEAASAASLAAVRKLASEGRLGSEDLVVAVVTSSALKDLAPVSAALPAVPVIEPTLEALREALVSSYGMELPTGQRR
jgi:threonine synthase